MVKNGKFYGDSSEIILDDTGDEDELYKPYMEVS